MKVKRIKILMSLLVFSLMFGISMAPAYADHNPNLNEDDLSEICDIEETEEASNEEESQSEEESHDEEENQEEAQDDTGSHQEGSENSKETHQEGSQDSNTSQENENNSSDAPEGEPAEDQSSDDDNNPEFQTLIRNGPMPSIVPFSGGGGVQDTIQVFKTANRHLGKCRQFEVELKITGEPQPIPVDVVVVIDKSGSMNETVDAIVGNPVAGSDYSILVGSNQDYYPITHHSGNVWKYEYRVNNGTQTRYIQYDPSGSNTSTGSTSSSGSSSYKKPFYYNRLHYAKKAANDFVDKVLGTNGIAGSRVALVTFSGPSTVTGQGSSSQAQRVVNLTSNINTLKTNINNITAIGGTNTQAGFNAARDEILANASANSNKFVVMFTDGVPTASNGYTYSVPTSTSDGHVTRAIAAGKAIFNNNVADVFTIGLTTGMSSTELTIARHLLKEAQNKGWYEAPTANDLQQIFDDIADLLGYAATNAVVTDKIGDSFDLVLDSLPSGATYNSNTRTITWNADTIVNEKKLTYRVVAKQNASGEQFTNEYATLTYTDVFDNDNQTKTFPKPKVIIPSNLSLVLSDATIILGDSISLGTGLDPLEENYMKISGGDGDGNFTYQWRVKGNNTIISSDKNPNVTPVVDTIYELTIIDSNGCIAIAEMKVTVRKLNIKVTKLITGNFANLDETFDFILTINGTAHTFPLGHEDEELITNVPKEALITLTEDAKDYTVTVTVGSETIIPNSEGIYEIELGTEDIEILVTNALNVEIDTGITLDNMPYILLLSTTLGFGIYLTIERRRRNR